MDFVIASSNPVVKALVDGSAPRTAQLAAARGVLPLPAEDQVEVLVLFAGSPDAELSQHAQATLRTHDIVALAGVLQSPNVAASVLDFLVTFDGLPRHVHESVLANPRTSIAAISRFAAETRNADLLDSLSLNQQLLVKNPMLLEAILRNPHRSSETDRRVVETKLEFFEKERGLQQVADELRAQGKEAAAEFIEKANLDGTGLTAEDAVFIAEHIVIPDSETDDSWLGLEFLEEIYEETAEEREAIINKIIGDMTAENIDLPSERISIIHRIMKMGMKDRMRLAMKGDREARNILIRDPNRLVSHAVVTNPRITEHEIELVAAMRSISQDVLRQIAVNRQWSRSYKVVHNLARNPRTPIANAMNILSRLQLRDLNALCKNRNVSDAVRRQALRLVTARTGK